MITPCKRNEWEPREPWKQVALRYSDVRFGHAEELWRPEGQSSCPPDARIDIMAEAANARVAIEHTKFNFFPNMFWCRDKYRKIDKYLRNALGGRRDILVWIDHKTALKHGGHPGDLVRRVLKAACSLPKPEEQRMVVKHIQLQGHEILVARTKRPAVGPLCSRYVDDEGSTLDPYDDGRT